jgi:hypothetical protein
VAFFTLLKMLDRQDVRWVVAHAFASGLLVSTRIVGIAVPVLTFLVLAVEFVARARAGYRPLRAIWSLPVYMVLTAVFTVLLWPTLWSAPLRAFTGALGVMAHFPFTRPILYLGHYIGIAQLPWHYIPVWIFISTPLAYTVLFVVGLAVTGARFLRHPKRSYERYREDLLFSAWFFGPLAAVIILHSSLYDGWRHMFFIYPAFVLLALGGIEFLLGLARARRHGRLVSALAVTATPVLGMCFVLGYVVLHHPYENVYFNPLLSSRMGWVKRSFEMDYWGLSYRQGLEYITRAAPDGLIRVQIGKGGNSALNILPARDADRIEFVSSWDEPDFFLGNYRWHNYEYEYGKECFAVRVCGEKIMAVYDLRPKNQTALDAAVRTASAGLSQSPQMRFAAVVVPASTVADSSVRIAAQRMAGRLMSVGDFCRALEDTTDTVPVMPALVLWAFDQPRAYPEPLVYMNDRENYISGGCRFTLVGADANGLVGAFVVEPLAEPRPTP